MKIIPAPNASSIASSHQPARAGAGFAFLLLTAAWLTAPQARAASEAFGATSVVTTDTAHAPLPTSGGAAEPAAVAPGETASASAEPRKKGPTISNTKVLQVVLVAGTVLFLANNPLILVSILGFALRLR